MLSVPNGATESVTLAQAKDQLGFPSPDTTEDALITALIVAACEHAERHTGRQIVTSNLRLTLSEFLSWGNIKLPGGNVQSITQVTYRDTP